LIESPTVRLRFTGILALLVVVLLSASASSAAGAARSFWIEEFAADIVVGADGVIDVHENIRFVFDGSFRGIYRDIPVRYRDNLGFDYRLRLRVVSVTGGEGEPLRHESSNSSGGRRRLTVYVPGAQDAARTVRIHYRVQRALRFFPEHDELYWNVTGNDWGVPIHQARAHVTLPRGLEAPPRVAAYLGVYGNRSDESFSRRVSGSEVDVRTEAPLEAGEGLTIVVGWEKGVVAEPSAVEEAQWLLRDNWPLLIPVAVFFLMLTIWRHYGRDPDVGRSVMPMYHPPTDLTPAELGALVDEKVNQRDIVATVVDLAVRGYLRIEEETKDGWISDSIITTFEKLKPADAELKPHERETYEGLFEAGDRVTIDDLENEFYERLGDIRGHVYKGLVAAGFFRSSPHNVRVAWLVLGIVVAAAGLPAGIVLQRPAVAIAAVVSGVIIMIFSRAMPARTRLGRHKWYEIKGFEEFLGRTEGDRLREMDVDMSKFETYLAFAMALGVAEQWGRAFEGLLQQAPSWYASTAHAHFSPALFSQRMGAVSQSVGTAMATAPRSSSSGSSGFSSGGGFSGGGFGGGGGGAF